MFLTLSTWLNCLVKKVSSLCEFFHSFFLHFFFENEGFLLLPFETLPFISLCYSSFFFLFFGEKTSCSSVLVFGLLLCMFLHLFVSFFLCSLCSLCVFLFPLVFFFRTCFSCSIIHLVRIVLCPLFFFGLLSHLQFRVFSTFSNQKPFVLKYQHVFLSIPFVDFLFSNK